MKVIYFTAISLNPGKSRRQREFLNANKLIGGDRFEVVYGKHIEKRTYCPYCKRVIRTSEEKMTDVNISTRILIDCFCNSTDIFVLVSADSDLLSPLEYIHKVCPQNSIKVYFPPLSFSADLKALVLQHHGKLVQMSKSKFRFLNAVMPDVVEKDGERYVIPDKWKYSR